MKEEAILYLKQFRDYAHGTKNGSINLDIEFFSCKKIAEIALQAEIKYWKDNINSKYYVILDERKLHIQKLKEEINSITQNEFYAGI